MLDIALLAGVAVILSSVVFVFGCVCHLFKRGPGFTTFENDLEAGYGNTVFSPGDTSDISQVTFETIPDILAKTVTATALRPRISCIDTDIQKQSAKRVASYKAFPRSHLTYIKEMGVGWFGQVLVSEAYNMVTSSRSTRVVVKMMKDDANSNEQQLFLQDLSVYRELDHPNILKLLGQCTEANPLLAIVEYASLGDLKSYLRKEYQIVKTMKDGTVRMQFLTDMAAGLECLHNNGYLHHDFACRNCVVMSNMTVKIGDYGVAEDHFREDYYDNGQDLLPIRWMAPESITLSNSIWQITQFTKQSNIWSFGVAMYEVTEYGQKPYQNMSDEMVLQNMIQSYPSSIQLPHTDDPVKQQLYEIMQTCWQEPSSRLSIEEIHIKLRQIQAEKDAADEAEFERKWAKMSTRQARVVKVEVHASNTGHELKHNVVDSVSELSDFNSNSLGADILPVKQALNDTEKKENSADISLNNESLEIVGGKLNGPQPDLVLCDNLVVNTPTRDRPLVHQFTSTPVLKDSVQTNKNKDEKMISQKISKEETQESKPKVSDELHVTEVTDNSCTDFECVRSVEKQSAQYKDENEDLKVHNDTQSLDDYKKCENDEKVKYSASVNMNNKSDNGKNSKQLDNIDSFIDFEKNYSENQTNTSHVNNILPNDDNKTSESCTSPIDENVKSIQLDSDNSVDNSDNEDNEDEELEKLNQLKLQLQDVLPTITVDEQKDDNSGRISPTTDDMDVAREIYMSKGMSMPPSKYTSTRSLNTILEDELLSESEIQPETKAASSELKFVEPIEDFSDSYQDSFEWDDYIGDELVGCVRNSDISPRQSIDFPDWTMEHDSSSQESHNESKQDQNSSSSDKKSSALSTPSLISESEVKKSPRAAHANSPKSPLGAAAHSYVKHILSNRISNNSTNKGISFYSFSPNIDLEEHVQTSSFNKKPAASQYSLMDEWDL